MNHAVMTLREFKLMILTMLLVICGPLGLSIHVSSLPSIAQYMDAGVQNTQLSVTVFLLGSAISMLVYGPISDIYGRKPIIVFGLLIAAISSFLSAMSNNITVFIFLRLLQGVGSGVCIGMGRVIATDILDGKRLAALGIYFSAILSLSTILSPVIGSYMQTYYGWQSNFILLGGIIVIVLFLLILFMEETNTHKESVKFDLTFIHVYFELLKNKEFIGCILLTGIASSASIVYITLSSFIFQNELNFSIVEFGWISTVIGISTLISRLALATLIRRLTLINALFLGVVLIIVSGIMLLLFLSFYHINQYIILSCSLLALSGSVFISGVTLVFALSPQKKNKGAAGAIFGALQMFISFLFSSFALSFNGESSHILAMFYVLSGLIALFFFFKLIPKTHHFS